MQLYLAPYYVCTKKRLLANSFFTKSSSYRIMHIYSTTHHLYLLIHFQEHAWFVGDMDRDQANISMQLYPIGTFLVRARLQAGERVGYALSLRTKEVSK